MNSLKTSHPSKMSFQKKPLHPTNTSIFSLDKCRIIIFYYKNYQKFGTTSNECEFNGHTRFV
jgi:hypothetical protein